jgi:hypothetical protein
MRHYLQMLSLSSIYGFGMNGASYSSYAVKASICMRCRAQNSIDANVIQLPRDLRQKTYPRSLDGLSASAHSNRSPTRLGGLAQPIS